MKPEMEKRQASASLTKESSGENIDDAFHEIDELIECWNNRLTINDLTLTERYVKGELRLVFNIRIHSESRQYRAILQGVQGISGRECLGPENFGGVAATGIANDQLRNHALVPGPYWYEQLVFVADIELMEAPKRVVPTLVWFEPADQSDSILAGALYFSQSVGFKRFGVCRDREVSVSGVCLPVGYNKRASEKVQRGTEIMDCVTNNGAPMRGDVFNDFQFPDLFSGCSIIISGSSVWIAVAEGDDLGFDVLDVFFGPFDLYPSAE